MALCAESAVLGKGRRYLGALEQHLSDVLVHRVEEPVQSSVLRRIELPQGKLPLLAQEYPANEHNLDYVDEFELLIHHVLNTCLEFG